MSKWEELREDLQEAIILLDIAWSPRLSIGAIEELISQAKLEATAEVSRRLQRDQSPTGKWVVHWQGRYWLVATVVRDKFVRVRLQHVSVSIGSDGTATVLRLHDTKRKPPAWKLKYARQHAAIEL